MMEVLVGSTSKNEGIDEGGTNNNDVDNVASSARSSNSFHNLNPTAVGVSSGSTIGTTGHVQKFKFKSADRAKLLCQLLECWYQFDIKNESKKKKKKKKKYSNIDLSGDSSVAGASLDVSIRGDRRIGHTHNSTCDMNGSGRNEYNGFPMFSAERQKRNNDRLACHLRILPYAVVECRADEELGTLQSYDLSDISSICFLSNDPTALIINTLGRSKLFYVYSAKETQLGEDRAQLVTKLKAASSAIGHPVVMTNSCTYEHFMTKKQQMNQNVQQKSISSISYQVLKHTKRHFNAITRSTIASRKIVLSKSNQIMEWDDFSGSIVSSAHLHELHSIVRLDDDNTKLILEYVNGTNRIYSTANRDALCVSLLDACYSNGYTSVAISNCISDGHRLLPRILSSQHILQKAQSQLQNNQPRQEALQARINDLIIIEGYHLKHLERMALATIHQLDSLQTTNNTATMQADKLANEAVLTTNKCSALVTACMQFNANTSPEGIHKNVTTNDTKVVNNVLSSFVKILARLSSLTNTAPNDVHSSATAAAIAHQFQIAQHYNSIILQSIYRIAWSPIGFTKMVQYESTAQVIYQLLKQQRNVFALYWTVRVLHLFISCPYQPHDKEQEYVNKQVLLGKNHHSHTDDNAQIGNNGIVAVLVSLLLGNDGKAGGWTDHHSHTDSNTQNHNHDQVKLNHDDAALNHSPNHDKTVDDATTTPTTITNKSSNQHHPPDAAADKTTDLLLMAVGEVLESVLCGNHDTTSPDQFQEFITCLSKGYGALMEMLRSPCAIIVENASLLLQIVTQHRPSTSALVRDSALSSATLLRHFYSAIFSQVESQRFLSRYLVGLWMSGNSSCDEKKLLKRILPNGFLAYLTMPPLSDAELDNLDELERDGIEELDNYGRIKEQRNPTITNVDSPSDEGGGCSTNMARLRGRIRMADHAIQTANANNSTGIKATFENFRILFHVLTKDHALPDLIWNQQTRRELRIALESEIRDIDREVNLRGGGGRVAWNHQQFNVPYPSLTEEVRVGSIYMRLWLQAGDAFVKTWDDPIRLFELLFRRLLCDMDRNTKVAIMCIRCLERLYSNHADKIGVFEDVMILVRIMSSTNSIETQHLLLRLVATLLGVSEDVDQYGQVDVPGNAEQLLNGESISQLCQFVAWGHTNSQQVGNLLESKTGGGMNMITDGTNVRPVGYQSDVHNNNNSSQKVAAQDACCPRVWFIAPAGAIPPPARSIRGPYRVSELIALMAEGDIHPHSLVSAAHVDDYNIDGDFDGDTEDVAVKEGHIDTGKWRMIEQVWQLRWQLCTDGVSTGIYEPSDVACTALKALTRLVDLHKSVDGRGVPYHPIPIAKKLLCGLGRNTSNATSDTTTTTNISNNNKFAIPVDQEDYLSVISQAMLANDHRVVESAASLITSLMMHNDEACVKLYRTGVFLFSCGYTGSNFLSIAKLLHNTHLKQTFRSGFAAAANDTDLPLKDRSILGNFLPEGVLFMLVNYGPERFTQVFVGNFDTPEVIWDLDMRKHLVEMIKQHLGDFPKRLWQNNMDKYEYCPMPGVCYRRLEKELFCHNYYLRNLCDEVRFPDWPIAEPIEVFRSTLEHWKKQMSRDQLQESDAQEDARKTLGLKSGDTSAQLRKSYRNLARKYHPDKNPAGRDMFEKVHVAYELLSPLLEGGGIIQATVHDENEDEDNDASTIDDASLGLSGGNAQMSNIALLMKTQVLICKRHGKEIGAYKYPAYRMLLQCLHLPPNNGDDGVHDKDHGIASSCLLKTKRAEFVRTAVELVFQTCLVSPQNAEELVSEGGVPILESLLNFYVSSCKILKHPNTTTVSESASRKLLLEIVTHIVRTLAGVAYFQIGRSAIIALENPSRFCSNWRHCINGSYWNGDGAPIVKKYALEGVASLARSSELQSLLIGSGIVWPLVRCLLAYDSTLEDVLSDHDGQVNVSMSQAASNTHAQLAARALGMLCGVMTEKRLRTPPNPTLYLAMKSILTEPIAKMLRNQRSKELLRTLNMNIETPTRIWNVPMRRELVLFLNKMEEERDGIEYRSMETELSAASDSFAYTNLANEIIIGGVYVRVFNGLGGGKDGIREISNCSYFAKELLLFLSRSLKLSEGIETGASSSAHVDEHQHEEANKGDSMEEHNNWLPASDNRFVMAVTALRLLVRVDDLIDDVLCDDANCGPAILLSLLELPQENKAFEISSDILSLMSPKQHFADSVSRQGELWRLLQVLERPETTAKQEDVNDTDQMFSQVQSKEEGDREAASALTTAKRQERGWAFLESLTSTPSIASTLVRSSGWLELLGILVGYAHFTKLWAGRYGSAKTLSRLLWDPKTGAIAGPLLQRFLPAALVSCLKDDGADAMLRAFDKESETPELVWDGEMRSELRIAIADQLDKCLAARKLNTRGGDEFAITPGFVVKYKKLEDELYIGGVYVRLFLKEPTFNLRDPSGFLEMVMQCWAHELERLTTGKDNCAKQHSSSNDYSDSLSTARQDVLQLVTSASVYLCKVRSPLCDKLAEWGYMPRTLEFLQRAIISKMVGTPLVSAVRVLHVASSRRVNVESLALSGGSHGKGGVVDLLTQAMGPNPLHRDTGFIIEILKNLFQDALGDVYNVPEWTEVQPMNASNTAHDNLTTTGGNPEQYRHQTKDQLVQHGYQVEQFSSSSNSLQQPQLQVMSTTINNFQQNENGPNPLLNTLINPLEHPQQALPHQQQIYPNNKNIYREEQRNHQQVSVPQQLQMTNSHQSQQMVGGSGSQVLNQYSKGAGLDYQQNQQTITSNAQHHFHQQHNQMQHQNQLQNNHQQTNENQTMEHIQARHPHFEQHVPHPLHPNSMKQSSPMGQQGNIIQTQNNPHQNVPNNTYMQRQVYASSSHPLQHQQHQSQLRGQPMHPLEQQTNTLQLDLIRTQQNSPVSQQHQQEQFSVQNLRQQSQQQYITQNSHHQEDTYQHISQQHQPNVENSQYIQSQGHVQTGLTGEHHQAQNKPRHIPTQQIGSPPPTPSSVPSRSYAPTPVVGSGINARSSTNPTVVAEQKSMTHPGAPGCAHGRIALLHSAVACDLPRFLVEYVLDNPTISNVKDTASVKVHAVALLKILLKDPGYGMKFELMLDNVPGWRKYKTQDHSLFITGSDQKADYFLTDGGSDVKKMLTQG